MENDILELADMIQKGVQRLLYHVNNKDNDTDISSPSIYMAPSILRDLSPRSFNPILVAIGPLHRKDENVQAFEELKVGYLIKLMKRVKVSKEKILESCMQKAYTSMSKIKACYPLKMTFSDAEIAYMMVMDACFILQFMTESHSRRMVHYPSVIHDLLLLENQIPLFFLVEIYECTISKISPIVSFIKLIKPILSCYNLFRTDVKIKFDSTSNAPHFLGLLHLCYKPPDSINTNRYRMNMTLSHSAANLDRAGVNFKPSKDPTWVMGMKVKQHGFFSFYTSWSKPTLAMPILLVHDSTEFILRNLLAYEQTLKTQAYVTSYATAMDMLVNTQEDVGKLVESGVLINIMGSNEEAANMINSVGKHISYVSYYEEEWEKLIKYCNGYWPKHLARMRSTYFSSPWNIIALVAGFILFVLQVVQTIFTIKSSSCNR